MHKLAFIAMCFCSVVAWADQVTSGRWTLDINTTTGVTDIIYGGTTIVSNNRARFKVGDTQYDQASMTCRGISQETVSDSLGTGIKVCVTSEQNNIRAMEYYYIYPYQPYLLTRLVLVSGSTISSNYMAPVYATGTVSFLPSLDNRNLFVPWDNDEWVRFNNAAFGSEVTSCEVTALYNATTRNALITGSLEHTVWKTGVKANTRANGSITSLELFGGLSNQWTRDQLPHGAISGNSISSPMMMIGRFSDWREGMETYADLNAIVAPKKIWPEGKPVIWNSWGVLQKKISYDNATQVAEWINTNLPEYKNDSTMYVCLDSYWTNLTTNRLKQFAKACHDRGQKAGIYWSPFLDWSQRADKQVEGAMDYVYSDIWLRVNGEPLVRTSATACDPTHPATRARMKLYMEYFQSWGFDFVKLDYMVHGAIQADSYYDPAVTTGMQAYSSGMQFLDSVSGDMYINLSISPLFPSQFAHGRRIACDSYGSLSETEYTLNSTTFGWWLDHVYSYNDADNIVLKDRTEGVNKVRILSGVLTGIMSLGDDFSDTGDETAKTRAIQLLNNKRLMQCIRQTHAFRPMNEPQGTGAASDYYTTVEDTLYVATINWDARNTYFTFDFSRLGLDSATEYNVTELWSGASNTLQNGAQVVSKKTNCLIFKIYPKYGKEGIDDVQSDKIQCTKIIKDGQVIILRNDKSYTIYGQTL